MKGQKWIPLAVVGALALMYFVNRAISGMDGSDSDAAKRIETLKAEIAAQGIRTEATVTNIEKIRSRSTASAARTYVNMTLSGTLPDGTLFQVDRNTLDVLDPSFAFDTAFAHYVTQVGATIPVIVHPTEHNALLIDEQRLSQLAAGTQPP